MAELDQSCSQGFLNGRLSRLHPVTPFVQAGAAGINGQGSPVFEEGHLNGIARTRFLKPLNLISLFQPLHHCLFDDGLAVGNAVQLRLYRFSLNRELSIFRNPVLPRQSLGALEKFVKAPGCKFSQQQLHSVGRTQPEIDPWNGSQVGGKKHPAVFHLQVGIAQVPQFPGHHCLQAKGGSGDEPYFPHFPHPFSCLFSLPFILPKKKGPALARTNLLI